METSSGFTERIEGLSRLVGIERVFGKPEQVGDKTILPVAAVSWSGGMGFGKGQETKKEDPNQNGRSGQGGGGGGKVRMRPVAVVEITAAETRIVPILDRTRIILAGMVLVAWNVFWVAYTVRKILRRRRW
jgi:uncharacterized spore protein YtfJ